MAQRSFDFEDQLNFARLSGDTNPLHVDPDWAATVFPGAIVVHGMHALLWGIEATWPGGRIASVSATFIKPILLGDKVTANLNGNMLTIALGDEPMVVARLGAPGAMPLPRKLGHRNPPARITDQDWLGRSGSVQLPSDKSDLEYSFSKLAAAFGIDGLRALVGLSTLVGMHCPGLRGLFAEFSVSIGGTSGELAYRVVGFDRRFNRITLAVDGGLIGTVAAFVFAPALPAPDDADLRSQVTPTEFAGQRPLIIGGSGGLGAITALVLAAGGARPLITYRISNTAAERIAQRIESLGGNCDVLKLDAHDSAEGVASLAEFGWNGGQAYYFATPRIFRRRLELYQAKEMHEFVHSYVDDFYDMVTAMMRVRGAVPLTLFYPSSTAIDDEPADLLEYAMAKQVGEWLCERLRKKYKSLSIVVERLPRIDTRQTQAFVRVAAQSPREAMLPVIRRIQHSS